MAKRYFKKLLYSNNVSSSKPDEEMKPYHIIFNIILLLVLILILLFSFRHQGVRDYPAGL